MKAGPRLGQVEELARHEVLAQLVRRYHHLQNEHHRARPESSARRRIEKKLLADRERLDRLLDEWVPDESEREAWNAHIHNRAPMPPGPPPIRPLAFRGVSDALAEVEVRGRSGEELDVFVDGARVARVAAAEDLSATVPPARFRLDEMVFEEVFSASDEALDALSASLADGDSPPWEHAPELLADGLVDTHVGLTPRGRRALAVRSRT